MFICPSARNIQGTERNAPNTVLTGRGRGHVRIERPKRKGEKNIALLSLSMDEKESFPR